MSTVETCPTCGGEGCEEGCGHHGGCESAHLGPNSHRICTTCGGYGRRLKRGDR